MSKTEEYDFEPLSIGSTGAIVLMVQKTLKSLGYELDTNGVFDESTDNVLRSFQENLGIVPNGILDAITMMKLDEMFLLPH